MESVLTLASVHRVCFQKAVRRKETEILRWKRFLNLLGILFVCLLVFSLSYNDELAFSGVLNPNLNCDTY